MILLLTGPVGSGKTTALLNWAAAWPGVGGIASPRAGTGRAFVDLASNERWPMDAGAGAGEVATLEVGRHRFSLASFHRADGVLRQALADRGRRPLALDEVGPLELRGQGFAAIVPELVVAAAARHVVLVVRAGLVEAVRARFGITVADTVDPGGELPPLRC